MLMGSLVAFLWKLMSNLRIAYDRLRSMSRTEENPTVQAMQIALHIPKNDPPARSEILQAAAQAVVACCLSEESVTDEWYGNRLQRWYDHRIRKVARRGRNAAWERVTTLPGVSSVSGSAEARAFVPGPVDSVDPLLKKLQISHTDVPFDSPADPTEGPVLYVDRGLGMSVGKTAAQVGHGSMLLAAAQPFEWVERWADQGYRLSVREVDSDVFRKAAEQPGAVHVIDAGFTEVAPSSLTVVALPMPLF